MNEDLLGIYIPTRNRPAELEECLSSIIPQMKNHNFPIYISDNSPGNETEELVGRLKKSYSRILYKRNELTPEKSYASNLLNVLGMGKTKFVWFFGDDDVLEEGAIDDVARELSSGGMEFIQIAYTPYSKDMKAAFPEKAPIKESHDVLYEKGEHNSVLARGTNQFLAAIIVKKEPLDKAINENIEIKNSRIILKRTGRPIETSFTHIFCYLAIVGLRGKLISRSLIRLRSGNNSLADNSHLRMSLNDYYEAIDNLRGKYDASVCDKMITLGIIPTAMLAVSAKIIQPQMTAQNKKIVWENKKISPTSRVMLLLLLSVPRPVYHTARGIIHKVRGKKW